jgi:tetratricopeptide (TPR) repeat protein
MDITTLVMVMMLIASAVGVDTVLHPTSVVLDAAVAGKLDKLTIDADALDGMLVYEVTAICSTPSILSPPEVRAGSTKGLGMALAETLRVQSVALALQTELGYQPEQIRLTLIGEDNAIRMLVNGSGMGGRIRTPPFQLLLTLDKDETLAALVHRAALAGMSRIDPYTTSLYLVQSHVNDGDFSEAEALIDASKAQLPKRVESFDRAVFENLQGLIALLRDKPETADFWFRSASLSDSSGVVAKLNSAFVAVQLARYPEAIEHVQEVIALGPGLEKTRQSTAWLIWGAALLGQNDAQGAAEKLARSVQIDPANSVAYQLWSDADQLAGDSAAARELRTKAWEIADQFGSYAEVAALYFRMPWKPGQKLVRSPFNSSSMMRFN